MKIKPTILSSNLINRYNMIFSVQALESALRQSWDRPLPSSIGHDTHRPAGWINALALHIQPSLARLFGAISYAEKDEELKMVEHVLHDSIRHQRAQLDEKKVAELRKRIGGHLSAEAQLHAQACVSFIDRGIASRVAPKVFEAKDADGLFQLRTLKAVGPGVFEHNGLLLFAHRFFRRSLSHYNTLNDLFLRRLIDAAGDAELNVRIALDEDLVGHPETLRENIELHYWWGPHFTDELAQNKWGITRHEASEEDRFYNAVGSTEFWWYEQDNRKTFECEELRDLNAPSLGQSASEFGCRFVHSILDSTNGRPYHLDGAVRLYSEDKMLERVGKNIYEFGRNAAYTKLWRIDGSLSVPLWKALITDYYRDNHLPGEYFGGIEENDEATRPKVITLAPDLPLHEFAPAALAVDDGVRLAISYHPPSEHSEQRRAVVTERLSTEDGSFDYFEAAAVELLKLLKRRRLPVTEPANTKIVMFDDLADNLPLLEHCGINAPADAETTVTAVRDYCLALNRRDQNRMLTFHIGVRYATFDANFSFAGHVRDLCIWFEKRGTALPKAEAEIGPWSESAYSFLTETFPHASDLPPLGNMIQLSGMLLVTRKFLKPDEFTLIPNESGVPQVGLRNCEAVRRASSLIETKRLFPTTAWILTASRCEKCGNAYQTCNCIKFIDLGVTQTIIDAELLGYFWTDRSAW